VPPRVDVADTDVIQITGTTEPGASISAGSSAFGFGNQSVTADGTGTFTINVPNVPLDQDVAVNFSAVLSPRPPGKATTTVKRTQSEGAFKAQTQTVPYGELVKGGSQGQPVMYRVKVFQFDVNTGPDTFLAYVTPGSYDIWNDVVMFKLSDPSVGSGVVNEDIVRVWGTVGAPQSYSTRIGGTNTVPVVQVKYLSK
jgi:hypothetical protein